MKTIRSLSAIFFLLFLGCGNEFDSTTLFLSQASDIKGFDPAQSVDVRTGQTITLVYDNLINFGNNTEIIPGVAKSWSLSPDGLTYIFELHRKFRFRDGTDITAGDVQFSLDRLSNSPNAWLVSRIDRIILPEGENGFLVKITLKEPFSPFIQFLAMPATAIINKSAVEHDNNSLQSSPAGSGPWQLEEWVRDGHMLFSANPDYFYGAPKLSHLKVRIISEEMTRSAEFETGRLDIMGIPQSEFDMWMHDSKWENLIYSQNELSTYYIGLNCSRPPFNDIRVRQAMNYSADREKILRFVLSGQGNISHGPIPPGLPGYDTSIHPYSFDPQKAKQLLSEAGYPNGFTMELWQSQASELAQVMEAFQSYWEAVGIKVKIVKNDWNMFKTAVREGKPDAYYLDWYADYPDGENFLFPLFHSSESMIRRNRYSNPAVDNLIERIQSMVDSSERSDLIAKIDRMIYLDAPWVFLWHSTSYIVTQPWIKGYVPKLMFNAQKYLTVDKNGISQ